MTLCPKLKSIFQSLHARQYAFKMIFLWAIFCAGYFFPFPVLSLGGDLELFSQPSMLVDGGEKWFLVNADGVVRGTISDDVPQVFPRLIGIDPDALLDQEFKAIQEVRIGGELAMLLIKSAGDGIYAGQLEIDFSNHENIIAESNGMIVNFGSKSFLNKWNRALYIDQVAEVNIFEKRELDLRFPNTVIVREQ